MVSGRKNQRRPVVQCFAERNEEAKRTELELELMKVVGKSLDGYGNYDTKLGFEQNCDSKNHVLTEFTP